MRFSIKANWLVILCIVLVVSGDGLTRQTGQSRGGGSGAGHNQSPASNQDTHQEPAIRVTSKIVQLSVIVHDKNGNPVSGLNKEEFKLYDQGQLQKIAFFSEQNNTLRTQGATTNDPASTQHAYTNRGPDDASNSGSTTVILLDKLNTWAWDMNGSLHNGVPMNDMPIAMTEVTKFLLRVQPQDRVAIYGLSDTLYTLRDFTNNVDLLLTAVGAEPENENRKAAQAWMDALGARQQVLGLGFRIDKTAGAFNAIARHLAGIPGRKNLVWVTAGLETPSTAASGTRFEAGMAKAIRTLADANVAVYPVDARGLIGPNMVNMRASMAPRREEFDTMLNFAEGTGGRAIYNTNDIAGSIRKSIDDSRVSYLLGYYPTNDRWDGGFRELKVKVDLPGSDVRARKGYYAVPDTIVNAAQRTAQLDEAIRSSLDSSELGLEVTINPVDVSGVHKLRVQTRVDPAQLHLEEHGGVWTDKLDVSWAEYDVTGNSLGTVTQSISVKLSKQRRESIASEGIIFAETVGVQSGAVEARLAVRDGGSGAIGSVNIPLVRLFTTSNTHPLLRE